MDDSVLAFFRAPATPLWLAFLAAFVTLVRLWPSIMARVNEARKTRLDADGKFRGDLLGRVRQLEEARERDQSGFSTALEAERRRCDAELASMRLEFERRIGELMNIIIQNSRSSAVMLGRPGDVAISNARKPPE